MILTLKPYSTAQQIEALTAYLKAGQIPFLYVERKGWVVLPEQNASELKEKFDCIASAQYTTLPYPLAGSEWKTETIIDVGNEKIGGDAFTLIAGPCSVENEEQIFATAEYLSSRGIAFIRGGAYKPRTSPYSFRGLGKEGLKLLRKAARAFNLKVVSEIMDLQLLDEMMEFADVLQVGSRNMQNFYMLNELGKTDKPILLKRGMHAKVKEWLLAAEYILTGGNENVILCERGIRSFDNETRNVMDVGVIPLIQQLSHLPIIADPSHGTGNSSRVSPLALAATAAGANGLLIEIHPNPDKALSDKHQALTFEQFDALLEQVNQLLPVLNKKAPTLSGIFKVQTL